MFEGFGQRLYKEMKNLTSQIMRVRIFENSYGKLAVWKGGSILSTLSPFAGNWVSRADYDEFGATVVHRKCF